MEKAFGQTLRRPCLVAPGDRVLVAVSGGADSVALLHLLRRVAGRFSLQLRAAHLDHAMRAESAADAAFVGRLCAGWEIPLETARVDVPALAAEPPAELEEAAREARRAFLLAAAGRAGCRLIALGHQRGDQAETFLQRLLRGSGPTGLAAMRRCSGPFIRPLLPFSRSADARLPGCPPPRLRWRMPPMPTRPSPATASATSCCRCCGTCNPAIEAQLARLSDRLGLEEDFWAQSGSRPSWPPWPPAGGAGCASSRRGLLALHPALRLDCCTGPWSGSGAICAE